MKQIKSLTFWPNGNVLAFDESGEQIKEVQSKGWLELYLERLTKEGYDLSGTTIAARMNDGEFHKILISEGPNGFIWSIGEKL